jgi:hypothetical protein
VVSSTAMNRQRTASRMESLTSIDDAAERSVASMVERIIATERRRTIDGMDRSILHRSSLTSFDVPVF